MALECRADGCHLEEFVDGYCEDHLAAKLASIRAGGEIDGVRFAGAGTREEPGMEDGTTPGYWTRERYIEAIQGFARTNGRAPTQAAWPRNTKEYPGFGVGVSLFGSWGNALRAAGFEAPPRMGGRARSQITSASPPPALAPAPEPELEDHPVGETITELVGLIAMMASLNRATEIELIYDDATTRMINPSLFRRLLRAELGRFDLEDIGKATLRHLDGEGVDLRTVRT